MGAGLAPLPSDDQQSKRRNCDAREFSDCGSVDFGRRYCDNRTHTVAPLLSSNAQTTSNAQTATRYPPEYTGSGDLILPKNFHELVYVGSPLTPNALNGGHAGFPEFHNVYIEPCSYAKYKETNVFPDGTIFFKELQLTLPPADSCRAPSLRGGAISLDLGTALM